MSRVSATLPRWTPFVRANNPQRTPEERLAYAQVIVRELGGTVRLETVMEHIAENEHEEVWLNSRYQVNVRWLEPVAREAPKMVHLSIKRRDKQPVGPERYRDFMAIKDELVGPECEAVELYPARSREVDTSTQYHLWVTSDVTFRWPFGFQDRLVQNGNGRQASGAVQNPMERHHVR